ncbi:MAG TPA: hypothetical protein PKA31_03630 [Candidatus Moranbacteria bacterium]|nr:hypothetical protein [Candidatus Moranbacteria bacterium]
MLPKTFCPSSSIAAQQAKDKIFKEISEMHNPTCGLSDFIVQKGGFQVPETPEEKKAWLKNRRSKSQPELAYPGCIAEE